MQLPLESTTDDLISRILLKRRTVLYVIFVCGVRKQGREKERCRTNLSPTTALPIVRDVTFNSTPKKDAQLPTGKLIPYMF